ncbi:MAG: Ig-like domain-containing protein, partial [Acidobacteriaceae bacterium]
MICRPAVSSHRFWILAACLLLVLGALPSHAHAQLTLSSFDIGASPNPVQYAGTTTFSAYVGGLSGIPTGSVTFYISGSAASCTGITDGNQIGTGDINSNTGVATVPYSAYTPGTIPVCANYSGDYTYSPDTAGVYLLTVEQPPSFSVQVVGAAEAQTPVNFAFTISVPNGQPLPTGSVTLYDEGNGNSYGPVNVNPDGSIPNIDGITLYNGYYEAQYSGDGNYQVQYFSGDVFQQNGLTAIIPNLIAAGSGDTTITLDGLNFDPTSVVAVAY